MPKTEKVEKVRVLTERFRTAGGAMFTEYRGLTVKDVTELRGELRKSDATFAVVKNTLTRRAATDAGLGNVVELLHGPTAVAFLGSYPVSGAKALLEAAKRFPSLVVKGALIEGSVLGSDDAQALATLERKEISVGKVAGMLQAPIARIIYLLQAPLQRIAYALAERGRGAGEDAPAAEASPAEEPAAAEAPGEPNEDRSETTEPPTE